MQGGWQDIVLSSSILGFSVALVPSIISKHKPHASTSIMTIVFQLAALSVYVSAHLWYAAAMSLLNAILWLILAVQKIMEPKSPAVGKAKKPRLRV